MFKYKAAFVLVLGTLAACQDSPVQTAADADPAAVTVIRPEEYGQYDISQPSLPRRKSPNLGQVSATSTYADIDYYSLSAYNGIFNGNDQLQLISVQNGFTGISYHSLSTSFYIQPGCSGSYIYQGGDSYQSYNGSPVGLSSQRTLRWPSSNTTRGLVNATHYFQAASGYTISGAPDATFYSSASECW